MSCQSDNYTQNADFWQNFATSKFFVSQDLRTDSFRADCHKIQYICTTCIHSLGYTIIQTEWIMRLLNVYQINKLLLGKSTSIYHDCLFNAIISV